MGSEVSKSVCCSDSAESSRGIPLVHGGKAFNCAELDVQKQFENYVFTEKAVWARALDNKAVIEAARIFGEIITLGLGAIARRTAGFSEHWAFIAKGNQRGQPEQEVYYVAQFGEGRIIPKCWSKQNAVQFHGILVMSQQDAELACCASEENTCVWVQNDWMECNAPRSLIDLESAIRSTPCSEREYSCLHNNCQHFAGYLYQDV
mmetsp:Transcript_98465/g.195296  ORF Transcript_98465/g.195296 Transcript_98465/m.195296 type:complete len:205 (+) Transcript_98465:83-697(+)|eukprot:CAMPEP_0172723510 /NCGR_PEP_ID=MMETSP1074-20121228/83918_1 /TAXON_ID=2916 /ORGANISM="Ceratium fusus, Strain PA161109" /LENGTH=204 /DNA_ID=CAMNT_0013549763 /DNA_START=69 /DNA_END=683 /DNA_ORIENTATION=+